MKLPDRYPEIYVVTGAESTGKSTLSQQLANHYNAVYIPEFARDYIMNIGRNYNYNDVLKIAKKQLEQYNEALESGDKLVFFDTWLIISKVWFEVVFGRLPDWIDQTIAESKIMGYLLCDTDIPWIADEVRENGGKKRQILHEKYKKNLELFGKKYFIVKGSDDQRLKFAISAIDENLFSNSSINKKDSYGK